LPWQWISSRNAELQAETVRNSEKAESQGNAILASPVWPRRRRGFHLLGALVSRAPRETRGRSGILPLCLKTAGSRFYANRLYVIAQSGPWREAP